ncbi:MAG TPA: pseudouridine synthase, partial [Flavisolibacter sp.]|nr:pseudouridine synthase [Flavisolibacter sp.]
MKKDSGFQKFYKGREKTGGAKKEEFRQDKRKERKEREEKIANAKREKRAKYKASFSNEPPKYNLEPPAKRSFKKSADDKPAPFHKGEKKKIELRQKPATNSGNPNFNSVSASQKPGFKQDKKIYKKEVSKPVEKRSSASANIVRKEPANIVRKAPKDTTGKEPTRASIKEPAKPRKPIAINKPLAENEEMPLNKYIAHSGVCSRREAVNLIKGGKVKVNGELVLEPGHKVVVIDDVRVAGRKLNPVKDFVYILLNKPKDYITTTDDPQERKTVLDLLKGAPPIRIYPVGRLDRNTSGVLLLTNDGDLAQSLTHPSNEIKKVYAVTLDKPLTRLHFEAILKGVV